MLGLMQDWPLLLHRIIDHAAVQHGAQQVVTRSVEGPIVRTTYRDIHRRAKQCAQRLQRDGVVLGDRVATLAWNTARHLEAWYGITGLGAIYHTVNPRLFPEQIVWIVNHAQDRVMMTDLTFVPLLEKLADKLPTIERYVIFTDSAHMPQTSLKNAVAYEDWIAEADGDFAWVTFDENTAAGLCYTSGTTGNPKGVLYSHRSNVLHAMAAAVPDILGLSSQGCILPVVPLFHANSWSIAFAAPMIGAKLVMPGPKLDGASLYELMEAEKVDCTAGVPTVWMMLLQYLEQEKKKLSTVKRVLIGGSAAPPAMIDAFRAQGIDVLHAWGMTEMSPIGSTAALKGALGPVSAERGRQIGLKQGYAPFTVEFNLVDDNDRPLPWDEKTFGRLKVRGPAVARGYYLGGGDVVDKEGWFDTGDIATICPDGYMQITDRAKDVIKSGGEWISSIDIENIAVGHPDVAEAAVIGMAHEKWGERPILLVVPKPGRTPQRDDVLAYLKGRIAAWWMPDDVQLIAEIPHTATGKINKLKLREQFAGHSFSQG